MWFFNLIGRNQLILVNRRVRKRFLVQGQFQLTLTAPDEHQVKFI